MGERHDEHKKGKQRSAPPKAPGWVKVLGGIGVLLIVLFVAMHFTGHSPFMHMSHVKSGE